MRPLEEVDGHLQTGGGEAQVDLLQLGVEDGGRVEESGEVMDLVQQSVLLHEDPLAHLAAPFRVARVVVGVHLAFVR